MEDVAALDAAEDRIFHHNRVPAVGGRSPAAARRAAGAPAERRHHMQRLGSALGKHPRLEVLSDNGRGGSGRQLEQPTPEKTHDLP